MVIVQWVGMGNHVCREVQCSLVVVVEHKTGLPDEQFVAKLSFKSSDKGYFRPSTAKFNCGQVSHYSINHRESAHGLFVVAAGHNI